MITMYLFNKGQLKLRMIKSWSVKAETLHHQTTMKTLESVFAISSHQSCSCRELFNPRFHTASHLVLTTTHLTMCLKYGFDASAGPHVPQITNQAVTSVYKNTHQLKTILFRHLNNTTSLILVQFPPSQKLSGPFIWAEAERGTCLETGVLVVWC